MKILTEQKIETLKNIIIANFIISMSSIHNSDISIEDTFLREEKLIENTTEALYILVGTEKTHAIIQRLIKETLI